MRDRSSGVTWTSSENQSNHHRKSDDDDVEIDLPSKIFAAAGDIKEINYSQVPGGVQVLLRVKPEKGRRKRYVYKGLEATTETFERV